jgi:hypothetical protein
MKLHVEPNDLAVQALKQSLEQALPLLAHSGAGISVTRRTDYALFDFVRELLEACSDPAEGPAVLPFAGKS